MDSPYCGICSSVSSNDMRSLNSSSKYINSGTYQEIFDEMMSPAEFTSETNQICNKCCIMLDNYIKYSHKIKKIKKSFEALIQQDRIKTTKPTIDEPQTSSEDEEPQPPAIEEEIWNCSECEKQYNDKILWKVHERYVHNIQPKEPPAICEVCGEQFTSQKLLKNHKLFCGENKKFGNLRCEECDLDFINIWKLQRHFMYTRAHNEAGLLKSTKYRIVTCDICDKKMYLRNLKGHMIIHENKMAHRCRICSKRCNQRGNLVIHMKAAHPTVMVKTAQNIFCPHCDQHFDKLEKFEVHYDATHC